MRALRSMTQEEREFAEQHHDLVTDFLRYRHLPVDDFYGVVILGYLSVVQQYFRNPPPNAAFKAMAFRAMKDSVLREGEYHARAKRCGFTVSLDDVDSILADGKQDTERQVEDTAFLERVVSVATPKKARIIHLLINGLALHESARFLKMPRTTAES